MVKKGPKKRSSSEAKMVNDNLRTLMANSRSHRAHTSRRIVKYGLSSFRRNIWLSIAATLVMTVTLVIVCATAIASFVLSATAETLHNKIDIVVYFKPTTTQESLDTMAATMRKDPNVKELYTKTSQEEYQTFLEEHKNDKELMATLDDNMNKLMVESMQATMHIKTHDPNDLDSIKNIINTDEVFLEQRDTTKAPSYDTDRSQIDTINKWANIAQNGGIVLSIVFVVISILVIFNTIRMAIFSRREEIYMMKLVGANNRFIRGPFLVEAQICGMLSGMIASTLGLVGFNLLAPKLANYGITVDAVAYVFSSPWLIAYYAAMVLLGVIIGSISARLAIRKYLR